MNRFINEADGSQTAFLDGNQPDRLCKPMVDHVEARGGAVKLSSPLREILVEDDGRILALMLESGERVEADEYILAMPVDVLKRLLPEKWSTMPFFRQLDELEGVPVINLQLWFDRKLNSLDGLAFSRSPLLSVYADMSRSCQEYYSEEKSMLELVFAPVTPEVGGSSNWLAKSDGDVVKATLDELSRLFPSEISAEPREGFARLLKSAVVRTPRSVYAATPGRNKFRPSQGTPIPNLTLAGCYTSQKFLGSMEGAVLAGKLAAESVSRRAIDPSFRPVVKPVHSSADKAWAPRKPKIRTSTEKATASTYGGGEITSKYET
jgi:15-cis-phytoene desaturase